MSDPAALELRPLDLPAGIDEVRGLVDADLRAIVEMVTERARQRMLLTRRQQSSLRRELWNRLVDSINGAVATLDPERR
jgi:hypothetical protein